MLDYEKENGTEDGLWGETQNGAEFALEVLGVGAGMALSGKGSHSSENDANIKTEGTGTVLADRSVVDTGTVALEGVSKGASSGAESALQGAKLKDYYRQLEKYGSSGVKELLSSK